MICHKLAEWKCTHTHKLYMEEETQNIHKEEVKAQCSLKNQFLRFPSIYLKQNCRASDETYGPGQQKVGLPYKIHYVGFDKEVNPVMCKMAEKKH